MLERSATANNITENLQDEKEFRFKTHLVENILEKTRQNLDALAKISIYISLSKIYLLF